MNANERPAMTESKVDENVLQALLETFRKKSCEGSSDAFLDGIAYGFEQAADQLEAALAALAACTPAKSEGR